MADEPRRSGRANKGHHTKNQDVVEEPIPTAKSKGKPKAGAKSQSARSESAQTGNEGEDDAIIRCVCGVQRDIKGRQMIACDICEAWQHVKCLGLKEGEEWESRTYYCEQCRPEDHVELLAAMERGEKPWNRKKGSRPSKGGAAGKQSRPSEVRSEIGEDTSSPKPQQAVPAIAAPAAAEDEALKEVSNGHATSKQTKKPDIPRSQPQSPIGEKRRRDNISEKDGVDSKRRKSSAHTQEKAPHGAIPSDSASLPSLRRATVDALSKALAAQILDASRNGRYRIPDGETPTSLGTRLSLEIDYAMVNNHGPPVANDSEYSVRFRSVLFNSKKNPAILERLLSKSLSAHDLTLMSAEDMAPEDKQREYAALREENDKQVVLVDENGPRIRKTHKGEELVDDDEQPRTGGESVFTVPERRHRGSGQEDSRATDADSPVDAGSPMRVELPEDVGRTDTLAVDTSAPKSASSTRNPSSAFDVKEVWRQVRSPDQEHQTFHRRQSSLAVQPQQPEGPGDDADIDRLLKDEENDSPLYSPADYSSDSSVCWHGTVDMQAVGPFAAVMRLVAGGDVGQKIPWNQILPPTIPITSRIENVKGNDYVSSMRGSTANDVAVLSVSPVNKDGRARLDRLFDYFYSRGRWGSVLPEKLGHDAARDLYIVPVEAGGGPLPPFLDMLEYCTIETPRRENMLLFVLIARTRSPSTDNTPTPHQQASGAPPSGPFATPAPTHGYPPVPTSHPGPQFPPVTGYTPGGDNYGSPYPPSHAHPLPPNFNPPPHHANRLAVDIFGPYIDAPVVVQSLQANPDMDEIRMRNLKDILDAEPAARMDMMVLSDYLRRKNGESSSSS
ncbi:hypothetical protein K432DRAFT_327365 [Lepidopterella palustris CBS 459.81]|uniref:Transcription factor BYE1 n=1 Tax=Lepidopterella palustris CBS 459.81 TaxID=1314670 RepID=A0A8E2EBS6_9PEZI|nr:hypothetical protein K432DRAFT_327365 [Lepidopterella palustris CBS 459.81]